jgi:hypothetical protein
MASQPQPYIVIRLVPESPVDGATFAGYLDGLALQVFDAHTLEPRSDFASFSPLTLGPGPSPYISLASVPTSGSTAYDSLNQNYGTVLTFNTTAGIPVGSYVYTLDETTIAPARNLQVTNITATTVELSDNLTTYVPAGTVVLFQLQLHSSDPANPPAFSFSLTTQSAVTPIDGQFLVLNFTDATGVTVGMAVTGPGIPPATPGTLGTTVAETLPAHLASPKGVLLSKPLLNSPPVGSSFTFTLNPPYAAFSLTPSVAASLTTLTFIKNDTNGVAVGMTLTPVSGFISPGTTVASVTSTAVVLSTRLLRPVQVGDVIAFVFPLSSGIAQHVDVVSSGLFGWTHSIVPAAVATAIIPLNQALVLSDYLDIRIAATRGSEIISLNTTYHNVLVTADALPTTPEQYEAIAEGLTSLYVALPPQPGTTPIALEMPSDGSAPSFDLLYQAIESALVHDPFGATVFSLISSPAQCARVAYDIVWSYQNTLPAPPDPVDSLYTNPPNPGGGGSTSTNNTGSNNFEQDRQKFEGSLSSFYSTRNANAERLAKFVAAVSAAVVCEQASLNSTAALLEFPVDPTSAFAATVESQLLVGGLGVAGTSGLTFGVPAAFFYALGANLDKSTTPAHRFQMATGDAIDRLLQQFATAANAHVISETDEPFVDTDLRLPNISSFQAARRLVALRASAASSTASVTVFAGSPLAALITEWLSAVDPGITLSQNPPLTYQNTDFNIWTQQLAITDSLGYVDLDLDAMTQGYVIPPFAASPSVSAPSGATTLTFAIESGIGVGMPVSGATIAPGTTVSSIATDTTGATGATTAVTLSAAVVGSVSTGTVLLFNYGLPPVTTAATVDCPSGTSTLICGGAGGTNGVSVGMSVYGTNVVPGTTVQNVVSPSVTLSTGVSADVPSGSMITFASIPSAPPPPVAVTTTADCRFGTKLLTFGGAGGTTGVSVGMAVSGTNIPFGTTVQSVAPTSVTLSTGVSADVPSGSIITVAVLPSSPMPPVAATTTADCPPGTTSLTFVGTDGISVGMAASGTNIALGTTVQSVGATTVILSTGVSADVPGGSIVRFALVGSSPIAPVEATTTADCPPGNASLTFGGTDGTNGISAGMSVYGRNVAQGTTVQSVATTTVTLSKNVLNDVPSGSTITFVIVLSTLADQIAAWLPSTTLPSTPDPTVATLKQVTAAQWATFFTLTGNPQWLPLFTQPIAPGGSPGQITHGAGYIAVRIRAFVRAVQRFFSVSSVATSAQLPPAGAPPTFDLPSYDPISVAVANVVADVPGFEFDKPSLSSTELATVVQSVFTNDGAAQAWLFEAMTTVNELCEIASVVPNPDTGLSDAVSFSFSVMEALYARGFRTAKDITRLSAADFQQALTGTVAYDFANSGDLHSLYCKAQGLAPNSSPPSEADGAFQPINPDGSLVNCIPPPCRSPTGAIAYLQEMLNLSPASSCEDPFATPASGQTTLGAAVTGRRGPLGDLLASRSNLETSLPLIDIVNESLEYLGAAAMPATGTVHDTAGDMLAGHALCVAERCPDKDGAAECHDPLRLFVTLPEHSTPAVPVAADATVASGAFNKLKADFSSCLQPYSQALDVSRTYLRHLRSCRYEEMRTFRKCITEFVLDPTREPTGFQSWLWRYPVRIDIAIEYLGITPEEYRVLFRGAQARPCTEPDTRDDATAAAPASEVPAALQGRIGLPAFLAVTCLSYCEFYELWQSGFVAFRNEADERDGAFPLCEPCCLDDLWLLFPDQERDLPKLVVFIGLWRKLQESCRFSYSFAQLRDICDVLQLYNVSNHDGRNPDFVRQLAAFQMLREDFQMDLVDAAEQSASSAIDADRSHLLALWVGPTAAKWDWAVQQLIERAEEYAQRRHDRDRRSPELVKLLVANLDPLSRLAGFDPTSATDSWHARPTHTLRFAEVLAKIYASDFSVGELIYLFTADEHLDGDDPFPLQEENEALDSPLGLPDEEHDFSLWRLRDELLATRVGEEECETWSWRRIEAALQSEFGFAPSDILELGQHFFPRVLADSGYQVSPAAMRFVSGLTPGSTSAPMWDTPADGPLQYDPSAEQLSAQLPLVDQAVIAKLTQVHDLNAAEQRAVQDLSFQPRAMLARFALLFADFAVAQHRLIEEADETERFAYFRDQFLLCRHRCRLIARHLSRHVAAATGQKAPEGDAASALILRALAADENAAVASWEDDSGAAPPLNWAPPPNGGALAALLGLTGTGLIAEYRPVEGAIVWRDGSGPLCGFGAQRDRENCPVPTVLPSFDATLTPQQLQFASVHNGFLMNDASGAWLGGAQGFAVTWSGALLVERDGTYGFWGGAPAPGDERPDFEAAERRQWRLVLRRGQRSWVILSHHWAGEEEHRSSSLPLKRGVYELTAELVQPAPEFDDDEQLRAQHTGFQVKYCGPDSDEQRIEIPHTRLFVLQKDHTLAAGIEGISPGAAAYLGGVYLSSLRDIRRTYQRAFKALLFAHRFALSAQARPHGTSELGYMLTQAPRFAGAAYYRAGAGFTPHAADFDFDFLPLLDAYRAPTQDARTAPSPQRIQAMFDWWERMFDYTTARAEVHRRCERHLWHLFEEAQQKQPDDPVYLLRHMGADSRDWQLELRYFQGQNVAVYAVSSADLQDDRWTLRAWHADCWLRALQRCFAAKDIAVARPDLWASDDPTATLPGEGETGNGNLSAFVCDGCLENGEPRRYEDLKRLNDGLRDRGRYALVAYLCHGNRVALPWRPGQFATVARDLSDLLLLDVETGICEQASRIEEAITAVQSFVRRSQLGLEPSWNVTREFARLWDSRFETYQTWERCKRRELYRENWIEWGELAKARRIDAFRFLESQLRTSTLTLAAPGGLDWWADDEVSLEHAPKLLQRRIPSELTPLSPPPQSTTREGLATLGTPEYATQPTWLAAVPQVNARTTQTASAPTGPTAPAGPEPSAVTPNTAQSLVQAAATGNTQPQSLPLWMESAMKLGTRFVRVAAAGIPQAALRFAPHGEEPDTACCHECGHDHPVLVDEYYFWLINTRLYSYTDETDAQESADAKFSGSYQFGFQDSFYDQVQQQSAEWNDENQVPPLLANWQPSPAVRLAWCRVHNGEFGQPRRAEECIGIAHPPDLVFLGRGGDSLYFQVTGSAPLPAGFGADSSPPGFRYDLPSDHVVALPQVFTPPKPVSPTPYPGGLLSYPFFAYHESGARLFPGSWFSTSLLVGDGLRARCSFELALRWYKRAFDPLQHDCAWVHCPGSLQTTTPTSDEVARQAYLIWEQHGRPQAEQEQDWLEAELTLQHPDAALATPDQGTPQRGGCCDSTNVTGEVTRHRVLTLRYCDTLVDWGDALMRRRSSPESFQQARLIYDLVAKITGPRPKTVLLPEQTTTQSVSTFSPAFPPLNPRLLDLYDLVADRLGLIHGCLGARRLRNGQSKREMGYFGDSPIRDGRSTVPETCADEGEWCDRPSPYRFVFQIQKAIEIAGRVRELGSALLSAYEKSDAEYLASIHADQEREMLALGVRIRQDQWRDADWQVQALHQTKDVNQTSLLYYANLYQNDLINDEIQNLSLSTNAMQTRTSAHVTEAIGEVMNIIPDFFVGAMSTFTQIPIGTKLSGLFQVIAKVMQEIADIQSATAAIDMTQAGWQRRSAEWLHQMQTLPIEIQQIELQILGAQRRRDQALQELNNQQRQIEHATEVQDFLRDKFTATELYLWLQKETAALHCSMYELALQSAREAQRAFNFERGHTTRRFIPEATWDSLHQGLMAGERLEVALRHMETAYLDENRREHELTKHISLRLQFPIAYLRLRTTGYCEIDVPEWMFDLDYPGHYMRRIKNVTLTLPCVTGPYTGVHCRLTLLSSMTRIDPTNRPPAHHGCREGKDHSEYEASPDDPRIVREYAARESIATSNGQNDSGMFELNFRDERYLPFEYLGAVSRWRIELPPANNCFDLDTLSDVILHLNYAAREGGDALRAAASENARCRLPGDGLRLFDVRHDFPDAWPALREPRQRQERDDHGDRRRRLTVGFTPAMFPFVPGRRVHCIDRLLLVFDTPDAVPGRHHLVRFWRDETDSDDVAQFECVADGAWPGFFFGAIDLRERQLGPLRDEQPTGCTFEIPTQAGEICSAYIVAHYKAERWPRRGSPAPAECRETPEHRRHDNGR